MKRGKKRGHTLSSIKIDETQKLRRLGTAERMTGIKKSGNLDSGGNEILKIEVNNAEDQNGGETLQVRGGARCIIKKWIRQIIRSIEVLGQNGVHKTKTSR